MDLSQYRNLFISESRSHLAAFNDLIVGLESSQQDSSVIDELFRHAHSLKGMAATMQYHGITALAHKVEDLLSLLRSAEARFTPRMADVLLEAGDFLAHMVSAVESGHESNLPDPALLIERLLIFSKGDDISAEPAVPSGANGPGPDQADAPAARKIPFTANDTLKSIRISTEVLDHLLNITGELITTRHHLENCNRSRPEAGMAEPLKRLSTLLRDLRDEVLQSRMLPFSYVSDRFPRLIRDLSRSLGKEVSFSVSGQEIALDRGVLEAISDPMVHILRNAVDHGLETGAERIASHKPPCGNVSVTLQRHMDQVIIAVSDDGKGMDPVRIAAKALEKGMITAETASTLSPQEAFMLICAPGFSTAGTISDISGRGVGMDAVKNAVHKLGGSLSIDSLKDLGSRFVIKLPVSVSIINALLVKCGQLTVAFPLNSVERTLEISREYGCNDDSLQIKSLNRLLGQPEPEEIASHIPAVVSLINDVPVALSSDGIIGQREIFVKPLGAPLSRMECFSGGTIMGDGQIIFVIDINALN